MTIFSNKSVKTAHFYGRAGSKTTVLSCFFFILHGLAPTGTPLAAQGFTKTRPLKAGVILPLTGDAANFGLSVKNGIELALQSLPPGERERIWFIYEDDGFAPKHSVNAFRKLHQADDLDVLVNAGSQTGKALAPLAEKEKIPFLSIASDPEIVLGRSYVMNFWVTPEKEVKTVLPEAKKRGYKKIARIGTMHDFVISVNRAFDSENRGAIEIALEDEYQPEARDFRAFIAKLKATKKLDAVMAVLMPGQIGVFARQLREQGVNLPMFGFEFFEDANEVKISNGALIGAWYVNAADAAGDFNRRYLKRYPEASLFAAANGHDIVLLLAASIKTARTADDINTFLHTISDFSGAMGTYSASGENTFTLPAVIKVVANQGFEVISD